jgi:hypothetical protein
MITVKKHIHLFIIAGFLFFCGVTTTAYSQVSLYVQFPTFVYHDGHFTAVLGNVYYPYHSVYYPYYYPRYHYRHRYYDNRHVRHDYYRVYRYHDNGRHKGWYKHSNRHHRR